MKKLFTIIIILISVLNTFAQDIILTKDGQKIEAKVEEVGIETIKYKKYNNQSGAAYLILKSDIVTIMYENGEFDVFSQEPKKQNSTPKVQKEKTETNSTSDKDEKQDTQNKQDKFTLVGKTFATEVAGEYQIFTFNTDKDVEYTVRKKSLLGKVLEEKKYTYTLKYPKLEIVQDNLVKRTLFFIDRNTIRWETQNGGLYEFIKL